jgi:DNA-binding transcriptional regulator YiaG
MNIEQARQQLGMTQAQLGRAIGVSERTIQNWEWGKTSPRPNQVKAIEQLVADGEPVTIARLVAIIESQQRVIEALTREHTIQ